MEIQIVGLRPRKKIHGEVVNITSRTLPTHHHKNRIAQETQEDFEGLYSDIEKLLDFASSFNNDAIVLKMKQNVPKFKIMNSTFAILGK
jgi:FlaA1/EpsC-like NDP-sugar epimerase